MSDLVLGKHGNYIFTSAGRDEAEPFVEKWHYSGSLNMSMRYAFTLRQPGGLFGDRGEILACCCFALPVSRNAHKGELELIRLVRVEPKPADLPISILVSKSLRWLTINATPEWKIVISYADETHEHHGGIYQATNFTYAGQSQPGVQGFRHKVNGEEIHKRTAYDRYGTSAEPFMKNLGFEVIMSKPKYLYVYPLAKGNANRSKVLQEFGYTPQPFPKPDWPGGLPKDAEARESLSNYPSTLSTQGDAHA